MPFGDHYLCADQRLRLAVLAAYRPDRRAGFKANRQSL
jgi:hypothetical protein